MAFEIDNMNMRQPLVSQNSGSLCMTNNTVSCAISLNTFPVSGPTSPAITFPLCNLYFQQNEASPSNLCEDLQN